MKKQQIIVISSAFVLLILLYFFGNTVPPKKPVVHNSEAEHTEVKPVEIGQLLKHAKERLTPAQVQYVNSLENNISRGDIKNQQIGVYYRLASFWRDSIRLFEPYAYYTAEAAKLENSEKSLTFAAHLFLNSLKTEEDPAMQRWLGTNAKVLFEQTLAIDPNDDSSRIGLGACYILGNISDNPMTGIAPIMQIVEKDPNNTFAHFILGLGGVKSGQYDKAVERFLTVVKLEPDNLEAALNLAEAYDRKGDKANAKKWYTEVRNKVPNEEAKKELDARINALK